MIGKIDSVSLILKSLSLLHAFHKWSGFRRYYKSTPQLEYGYGWENILNQSDKIGVAGDHKLSRISRYDMQW